MKNVKNASPVKKNTGKIAYWQIDYKIKSILETESAVVLPSPEAWKKIKWSRSYFEKKPESGYFIWIKKQPDTPLRTCISIANKNIHQKLQNLLIVEKNLNVDVQGLCNVLAKNCQAKHQATGKIILRAGSTLTYDHTHLWDKKDIIEPSYNFILEKNSKLNYTYKNLLPPKILNINTTINLSDRAKANLKILADCIDTTINITDTLILKGKESSGIVYLRIVGKKNSQINSRSRIIAEAAGKGHLDCQGLLISQDSEIKLSPEIIVKNKNAAVTHEAAVGKISEKELNYLRTRGLSETEAINLIVAGFLVEI